MRRRPTSQNNGGYNNPRNNRPRHSGGGHHNHGGNRPRKNYAQAREKYLAQARDALSAGDRVLAENWFQHADHCYRMMVEEGYNPRQAHPQQSGEQQAAQEAPASEGEEAQAPAAAPGAALPSFITSGFPPLGDEMAKEPVIVQNWEERDA